MDDLKLPKGPIPQDPPEGLSMEEYYEFVMFNWGNFPHPPASDDDCPVPVRFVLREEDGKYEKPGKAS